MNDFREILSNRILQRKKNTSRLDVQTNLKHFALINYAVEKEKLLKYIPEDRFEIPEFNIQGKKMAMMSAVPFLDIDFHFPNLFPSQKFSFMQTNYRVYILDKKTNQHSVWFFGTTLGSYSVYFPKYYFKIPWEYAKYKTQFEYNTIEKRYYQFEIASKSNSIFGKMQIEIEDTGRQFSIQDGFKIEDEMKLILTHPVSGFFKRRDNFLGSYSIWHPEMKLSLGKSKNLYFELFENLSLLDKEEMQNPHSIFICPDIFFEVYLPPTKLES